MDITFQKDYVLRLDKACKTLFAISGYFLFKFIKHMLVVRAINLLGGSNIRGVKLSKNNAPNLFEVGGSRRARYGTEPLDPLDRRRNQTAFSAISRPCIEQL